MDLTTGGYRATRDEQGVLTIHHVPIFVECSKGKADFDIDWIVAAVQKAKLAEIEGYLPPLHVRHHEDGPTLSDPVRAAGFFRITGAEPIQFKGQRRMAVFADLVITDPGVSMDVLAKRLPYRSVEIFDVDAPAIDSLALLDHEAPYLELPMLLVSTLDDAGAPASFASTSLANPWLARSATLHTGEPVACFRRGKSAHLITEDPMGETELKTEPETKKGAKAVADAAAEKLRANATDAKGGEDEKGVKMAVDTEFAAILKALSDGSLTVAQMDALLKGIAAARDPSGANDQPTVSPPAPANGPGEALRKALNGPNSVELAKVASENAVLKARLDEIERGNRRKADVAVALKRLEGRQLGGDIEKELLQYHSDFGPKAFEAHVGVLASKMPAMPALGDYAASAFASQPARISSDVDEAVNAYMHFGSEAMQKAAGFAAEYRFLQEKGSTRVKDVERYLELNMGRHGYTLRKRKSAS